MVGKIVVDDNGNVVIQSLNRNLDQMQEKAGGLGGAFGKLGDIASFAIGGLITKGVEMATGAISDFAKGIMDATMKAQDIQGQLNAVLQSTHGVAGMTADAANKLAESWAGVSKFSKDTVLGAENVMLTFTAVGKDVFPGATEAALNLSQSLGQDLQSSVVQVGKALADPIKGISALHRVGVEFTQGQKDAIAAMVKTGDIAGAQKIILAELGTEFGNSAKAAGETFSGKLAILNNKMEILKEGIGNAFLPIVTKLLDAFMNSGALDKVIGMVNDFATNVLPGATKAFGTFMDAFNVGAGATDAVQVFDPITHSMKTLSEAKPPTDMLSGLSNALRSIGGDNTPKIFVDLAAAVDKFRVVLGGVSTWWDANGPGITASAMRLFGVLKTAFDELAPKIQAFVSEALSHIGAWFVENGPLIQSYIAQIVTNFQTLMPVVQVVWDTISPLLLGIVDLILNLAKMSMQIATGDWKGAWTTIQKTVMDVARAITDAVKGFVNGIMTLFGSNMKQVQTDWQNNWNLLQQISASLMQMISSAIGEKIDEIKDFFVEGVSSWINTVSNAIGDFYSIGGNIIDGILSGLKNNAGQLIAYLTDLIKGIIASVQALLGISSPSKIFAEIGHNLMAGLAQGIGKGLTMPITALLTGTSQIVSTASGAAGSGSSYYHGGSSVNTRNAHYGPTNNFYVSQKPTPDDILKLTRKSG